MGYHIVARNPETGDEYNPVSYMGCLAGFNSAYIGVSQAYSNSFNDDPTDLFFRINTNDLSKLLWDKLVSESGVLDVGLGDRDSRYDYIKIPHLTNGDIDYNTMHFYLNPYRLGIETSRAGGLSVTSLRNKKHIDIKTTWFARHFIERTINDSVVVPAWHQSCYSRLALDNSSGVLLLGINKSRISAVLNADKFWRKRFPITGDVNRYTVTSRECAWGDRRLRNIRSVGPLPLNTVTKHRRLQSLYSAIIAIANEGIDADITKYGWDWT